MSAKNELKNAMKMKKEYIVPDPDYIFVPPLPDKKGLQCGECGIKFDGMKKPGTNSTPYSLCREGENCPIFTGMRG